MLNQIKFKARITLDTVSCHLTGTSEAVDSTLCCNGFQSCNRVSLKETLLWEKENLCTSVLVPVKSILEF